MRTHRSRQSRPTGRRLPRLLAGLLASALGAGLLVVLPTAAHASGNSLYFSHNGSDHASFGANGVIMIDGAITFDDNCLGWGGSREGTDDFVYPATDVYIVEAGSATDGSGLTDAAGDGPNTIVGTGSGAFLGELIGVVTPTGMLGEGEFDIVYDTCQDGVVDAEDEIFYDAITVDVPDGQLPPVDGSIRQLKDRAREEYATWLIMHMGLQALFKLDDAKAIASCLLAPSPDCLFEVFAIIKDLDTARAKGEDWIEESTLKLIMNRAKNYGAIWKDPADPTFHTLPSVAPEDAPVPPSAGQPIADAVAGLTAPLAQEGALTEALLHALERYQGAQAAGDEEWALVQARAVRDLSAALDQHLGSSTAVADLRAALAADIDDVEANAAEGAAVINRIRQQGFTPAERRQLANRGLTAAQIGTVEDGFVRRGRALAPEGSKILGDIDDALAAQQGMREALTGSTEGWNTLVEALEERVDELHPEADAGGPYGTRDGGPVTLDASASSAAPGAARLTDVAWDLDADGQYDDAAGAVIDATVASSRTVAVKVTDDAGRSAVDFAQVTVESGDRAPVISSTSPGNAVELRTGTTQAFTVAAVDPDGGVPTYRWTLGGEVVAGVTGSSFSYAPTAADVGSRMLSALVSHNGRSAAHSWVVTVTGPDADGDGWTSTPDCDDTRADVNPGAFERVGNGINDDCDALTQDAPTGGLTGSVMAWGHSVANGLPAAGSPEVRYSPTAVPSLGSSVRSVETAFRTGFAVMAGGSVKSWGQNFNGVLGNGNQTQQWTPVAVKNVDGKDGELGGVEQLAVDDDTALALRSGGSVVAWGSNLNQQLGDGSLVDERLTPVTVRDETAAPLTGITQVEEGENTSYAVTADGNVRNWGVVHCDASLANTTRTNLAAVNPLFGAGVVQVVSGDSGGALARRADGSVLSCSAYDPMLGRTGSGNDMVTPKPITALGTGVVDVAMGMSSAAALKGDGTVWTWGRNLNHTLDVIGLAADYIQELPKQVTLPAGPPVVDIEMDYSSTTFATRADGSVLVWGANVYGSGGTGVTDYGIAVPPKPIDLKGNLAMQVSGSTWNGLALVRPADDPTFERPAQYVTASVADTSIGEAAGGAATLTLSEDAPDDLTVTYTIGNGPQRTAPVSKGARTAQLPVTVPDDQLDEDDEQLPLQVVSVSHGVRVGGGSAIVTVLDDDAAPTVSVASVEVDEGDTSLTDVPVTVSLSKASGKDVEVLWHTAVGSAVEPGDYTEASGHVLVPAGATSATAHVAVNGDTRPEPAEAFAVRLSDPVNATVGNGEGAVTIADDDPLQMSVESPSVTEGGPGTTPATFTVSVREVPAGESLTVPWSVMAGTAELGSDVVAASGSLSFDAAHLARQVTVAVVGDTKAEPLATETFSLELGTPDTTGDRVVVPTDSSAATIADDDTGPSVSAGGDVTGTEGSPVAIVGQASAPSTWTVDAAGCTVADRSALSTTVTCVDETTATLTLTADDGENPSVSDTAVLTAGNVAPTVTVTAPSAGTTVQTGQQVTVASSVADPGTADVLSCSVAWGDGATSAGCSPTHAYTSAGSYDLVVTGSDGDGGHGSATVRLTVVAPTPDPEPQPSWPWQGFFAPVDNLPVVNSVKAGSTVPLKFSVGGYRGMDIFAAGYPASGAHSCTGGTLDALEETATPGASELAYDAGSQRYHYNWKTQKSWAGQCRTLTVKLADGNVHTAEFRLK